MQAYEGVPSEPKERHPILRLGRRRVHQELLQPIEQSRLQQKDLTRKLTKLAEDMGEQVDRLSGAPRETPLPEWAVRAFTRLAEDPLHTRERPATDQSSS